MTAGIDEAPGYWSTTVIERVDVEDVRSIPVGWRWRCCTKGCGASESGLTSYSEAASSPRRIAHVCARPDGSGYRHGDLVTVADIHLEFGYRDDQWAEVLPPGSQQVGFTVHESEIHP